MVKFSEMGRGRARALALGCLVALLAGTSAHAYWAGGGKDAAKGNDCLIGYDAIDADQVTQDGKKYVFSCTDCDPSCDRDGVTTPNNSCTVEVGLCINQSGVEGCTPPAGLDKAKGSGKVNGVKGSDGKVNITVPQLLEGSACGALVDAVIPIKQKKNGDLKDGKATVNLEASVKKNKTEGTPKRSDKDKLTILCVPRPTGEACPIPTTTTSSSTTTTIESTTTSTTLATTTSTMATTTSTLPTTTSTLESTTTSTSTTSTTSTTGTTIFAGPAFPPVGGTVEFDFTGGAQSAGGADVSLFDFSPTTWTALYWGPFDQNVPAAGLDGTNHVLATFLGISGVGDTVATWEGTSPWTNPGDMVVHDVPIRFTLTIVAGGLSFEPSTGIPDLDPGPGTGIDVVIDVAPGGTATDFTTNWAFTADIPTDLSGFIPLSDVPQLGGTSTTASFGGGFYSQP